jgi:phosphatidylserine decarboxylase
VCKRNLNPIFKPKDATFDFPIYMSHLHKLGVDTLKFVVCQWDKDITVNGILGEYELPVKHWFKGTAFAFDDPNDQVRHSLLPEDQRMGFSSSPQPFFFGLLSSRSTTAVRGTVRTKVGFVHPPNSTVLPDFEKTYNILTNFIFPVPLDFGNTYSSLANSVYPVGPQADHVGVVTLLIWGARGLPDWPTGEFVPSDTERPLTGSSHSHRLGYGSLFESDNWR